MRLIMATRMQIGQLSVTERLDGWINGWICESTQHSFQYHMNTGSMATGLPPIHQLKQQSDEQQRYKCAGIHFKAQILSCSISLLRPLRFLPFSAALGDFWPPADDLFFPPEDLRYET